MLLKTLLASLAAKIAVGTGLTLATVTAAGAAGVLPEPAQNAVASVVEATTPFALADQAVEDLQDPVDGSTTTTSTTIATNDGDDAEDGVTDKTRKANHGACVSTVAKNTSGPDKGKTVSSVARSDCGKQSTTTTIVSGSSTTSSSTTSTTVAGSSTTSSTVDAGERSANSGPGSANSGRGNSRSSGSGNSGKK